MVHANPALVEASALKPRCCRARALPTSHGFGSTKQPLSCNLRKVARLSVVETAMVCCSPFVFHDRVAGRPADCERRGANREAVFPHGSGWANAAHSSFIQIVLARFIAVIAGGVRGTSGRRSGMTEA